jgi:hypothetical protein
LGACPLLENFEIFNAKSCILTISKTALMFENN